MKLKCLYLLKQYLLCRSAIFFLLFVSSVNGQMNFKLYVYLMLCVGVCLGIVCLRKIRKSVRLNFSEICKEFVRKLLLIWGICICMYSTQYCCGKFMADPLFFASGHFLKFGFDISVKLNQNKTKILKFHGWISIK